ncbi:MAG: tyrosine-type recombinase/integrase [Desulfobacterales bacterium]|jgi:integrase
MIPDLEWTFDQLAEWYFPIEYNKLIDALPFHTKAIVAAVFWTGMRRNEILYLTWDKVDLQSKLNRLNADDTKEGHRKIVPISTRLKTILMSLPNRLNEADASNYVYRSKKGPFLIFEPA